MHNGSKNTINFSTADSLVLELDEQLPSTDCKNLLFRIYNLIHGTDVLQFCNGRGRPTRFAQGQAEACC
jgi:hypothetical protein